MSSSRRFLDYRPDIDALRALAVLSVVVFHAQFSLKETELMPGGFLGVDVFFVISGYLITSLIFREFHAGQFSFMSFYERRARRLLPALLAMLLCVIPLGWFLLLQEAHDGFLNSLIAAVGFVSNFYFLLENPYGANALAYEPLLHTWSLAVEEQYYLMFPLLFLALLKWQSRFTFAILAGLLAASFLLAALTVPVAREFAFYMLPTRLWELLAGGLLALGYRQPKMSGLLSGGVVLAGLVLIVGSMLVTDEADLHPSWITLIPVIGTLMVIRGGEHPNRITTLLSSRPTLFGLISYSLYLWHQPLLVFARYYYDDALTEPVKFAVVTSAIVIAVISWRWLERPARNPSVISRRHFFAWLIGTTTIVIGISVMQLNGLIRADVSADVSRSDVPANGRIRKAYYGSPDGEIVGWLLGDSHANALASSFDRLLAERGEKVLDLTYDGCLYTVSMSRQEEPLNCYEVNQQRRQILLASAVSTVIVFMRATPHIESAVYVSSDGVQEKTDRDFEDPLNLPRYYDRDTAEQLNESDVAAVLLKDLLELHQAGKQLIIVEPVPEMARNPFAYFRSAHRRGLEVAPPTEPYTRYLERNAIWLHTLRSSDLRVVRTAEIYCDGTDCFSMKNDRWLYEDDDHPSIYGADLIVQKVLGQIDRQDE